MVKCFTFNFRQQAYLFKFQKGFFALCLFFLILTCILGFWQVFRYHYKQQLGLAYQANLLAKPVPFSKVAHGVHIDNLEFKRIILQGIYLNPFTVLIQNRFHNNKPGVEVLTPVRIPHEKKLLLVNRGWIENKSNQSLPKIEGTHKKQEIIGYIKLLNEKQFILGKNILNKNNQNDGIFLMQKVDIQAMNKITQEEFFPYILRLDQSQPYGFARDWVITTVVAERHLAYAVQWFLMALAIVIGFICFCCERVNE